MKQLQDAFYDGMSHKSPESRVARSYLHIYTKLLNTTGIKG